MNRFLLLAAGVIAIAVNSGCRERDPRYDYDGDGVADDDCVDCDIQVPGDAPTLQEAIDGAIGTIVVCVAPGTYFENIDLGVPGVHLLGLGGPAQTVIDGAGGPNSVVRIVGGVDESTILEGFTITNGHTIDGGGVFVSQGSPTLRNLEITGNTATSDGGGVYLDTASPTLRQVTITGNTAAELGGGLAVLASSWAELDDVLLEDNMSDGTGGGMIIRGGGGSLTRVIARGNVAQYGGGIAIDQGGPRLQMEIPQAGAGPAGIQIAGVLGDVAIGADGIRRVEEWKKAVVPRAAVLNGQ